MGFDIFWYGTGLYGDPPVQVIELDTYAALHRAHEASPSHGLQRSHDLRRGEVKFGEVTALLDRKRMKAGDVWFFN